MVTVKMNADRLERLINSEIGDLKRLPGCTEGEVIIGQVRGAQVSLRFTLDKEEWDDIDADTVCLKEVQNPV